MVKKFPLFRAKSQQIEWVLCMVTTVLLVAAKLGFAPSCRKKLVRGAIDWSARVHAQRR